MEVSRTVVRVNDGRGTPTDRLEHVDFNRVVAHPSSSPHLASDRSSPDRPNPEENEESDERNNTVAQRVVDSIGEKYIELEKHHRIAVELLTGFQTRWKSVERNLNVHTFASSSAEFRDALFAEIESIKNSHSQCLDSMKFLKTCKAEYGEPIPPSVNVKAVETTLGNVYPTYYLVKLLSTAHPNGKLCFTSMGDEAGATTTTSSRIVPPRQPRPSFLPRRSSPLRNSTRRVEADAGEVEEEDVNDENVDDEEAERMMHVEDDDDEEEEEDEIPERMPRFLQRSHSDPSARGDASRDAFLPSPSERALSSSYPSASLTPFLQYHASHR